MIGHRNRRRVRTARAERIERAQWLRARWVKRHPPKPVALYLRKVDVQYQLDEVERSWADFLKGM
ncbi:MAG TPA: hypothetical protein PLB89_04965 [Flavobacteriales bacterium]|nr:hypothetical protein [Flavobacteriales bacterium]